MHGNKIVTCVRCGRSRKHQARGLCSACYEYVLRHEKPAYMASHNARSSDSGRRRREKFTSSILELLGNKCACCGQSRRVFLQIDHVNNDGADHRKSITGYNKGSLKVLKDILLDPDIKRKYQILCANCHLAKTRKGVCTCQLDKELTKYVRISVAPLWS